MVGESVVTRHVDMMEHFQTGTPTIVGGPAHTVAGQRTPDPAVDGALAVRFWGVRGTSPCPGQDFARYGGNTACVEVRCGNRLLIFDAGSGIRELGRELKAAGKPVEAHVFLTHTHLDHILGLPFFKPAYLAGNRLNLWNGHLRPHHKSLHDVLCRLMESPYFPVPFKVMHADIDFNDFEPGQTLAVGTGIGVRTTALNHPGGATGYRVDYAGKSFCFITDTEHRPSGPDQAIVELIRGSDLVVYDTTYTDQEYERYRGWGHSTWEEGLRLCDAAGAKRLLGFHHDPEHDDRQLDAIEAAMARARPGAGLAREGMIVRL